MTTFDFSPGAQVPVTEKAQHTAATQALASAAWRDEPVAKLVAENEAAAQKPGRFKLFEPNLGEAFCRAVQLRMLGGGRAPVVQSFGVDAATVVQHCLAASRIRRERDVRLTTLMAVFGLVFLPATLLWMGAFELRRRLQKEDNGRNKALGALIVAVVVALALLLFFNPPFRGIPRLYLRTMLIGPVVGWFLAQRVCRRTADQLRTRWTGALEGTGGGPTVPEAVPKGPNDSRAEHMREELEKLIAEQNSNVVFYQGRKGILGMGPRWGAWHLAEELVPRGGQEIHPFRSWDVIRAIQGRLRELGRGPLHTGGFPQPLIKNWVVIPIGEGAGGISRPAGPEVEGYSIKEFEVQRICNESQFDSGSRHYLGVQFVLWDGGLVLTLLCTVTVLHHTLRVEITGHALGPVTGMLSGKPSAPTKQVAKSVRFWETKSVPVPLVGPLEVIRLAVRAPFVWYPPLLDWLGGKLALPEPFGLRHAWAGPVWAHRFMADDALRTATPVVRAIFAATIRVLEENGVDTSKFSGRADGVAGSLQGVSPGKPDDYGM